MVADDPAAAGEPQPDQSADLDRIIRGMVTVAKAIRVDARFLPADVSFVDFTLLYLIGETPGLRAVDLAAAVGIDKSTASRQLGSLERRELIRREPDEHRARSTSLWLTARARTVLADAHGEWRRSILERTARWPDADVHAFAELIERYTVDRLSGSPHPPE